MFNTEPFDVEFSEQGENLSFDFNDGEDVDVDFDEIHQGGGGITRWSQLLEKPFERIGETLSVQDGTLEVNIHEVSNDAGGLTAIIG